MINLKSDREIYIMREGAKILVKIMKELKKVAKTGVTTQELDSLAKRLIQKIGATPSFLNFEGYPAVLCTSLNEEIVHVTPSERKLQNGDILSLDLGICWRGYHNDMAVTFRIGKVTKEAEKLFYVTKKALEEGIKVSRISNTIGDIGHAIQQYVEAQGFNVIRDLCGHGIGKKLHEDPQVLNFGGKGTGPKIKEGMVFCIEPMTTIGDWKVKKTKDGFGYKTKDGSLSCHFEHEVAITKKGPFVLTRL